MDKESKIENLTNLWIANNTTHEGLVATLRDMGVKKQKKEEPTIDKVNNDWKKLAAFMSKGM